MSHTNGMFRPYSKKDFSFRSRKLSRLIDERLMKSMQILARIYGYRNLHVLHAVLKEPGEPGPYDMVVSEDRILKVIAQFKGVLIEELAPRFRDATELGLFNIPPEHRQKFRALRDRWNIS